MVGSLPEWLQVVGPTTSQTRVLAMVVGLINQPRLSECLEVVSPTTSTTVDRGS